jgi:hypothetical protein
MALSPPYSSDQHNPAAAIPVYVVATLTPFTTDPAGMGQIDLSNGAVHPLPAPPDPPQFESVYNVIVQAQGADVTWSNDGTDPSATHGFLLKDGEQQVMSTGETFGDLRFIALSPTGAKLNLNWQATPTP